MFIDSITVMLFLATVTIQLAKMLKFDPVPIIIAEIFASNVGGSATMSGDPPNIIIGTALGLRCNTHAQALDIQGQPVEGLYAVGNDMHSIMGGQYPAPGITLGPALTFGWIAGQHLANP